MTVRAEIRPAYYAEYVPRNQQHFNSMLQQFRHNTTKADFEANVLLWVFSPEADRQDILVAQGRVEREKGWR